METLPKGIDKVEYSLKDGSKALKYRVRRNTKALKVNKLFSSLLEAVDYLNTLNTGLGSALVRIDQEAKEKTKSFIIENLDNWLNDPDLDTVINNYCRDILKPKDDREISKLNNKTDICRMKNIGTIKIDITPSQGFLKINEEDKKYKKFKDFLLSEINDEIITKYITARIEAGRAKKTIQKELTELSKMFNEIPDFMKVNFKNPVPFARKTALNKLRTTKRTRFLENEEITKLQKELEEAQKGELLKIVMLSAHTSLRRSEVVTLEWPQIFEDYIELKKTKNGEPRSVWLNLEARAIIKSLEKREDNPKLFNYTIAGFKTAWTRFKKEKQITDLRFHDFRKKFITDTIQKQIEQSGIASVFGLGKSLGIVDLDNFKKEYVDQEQAKYNHKKRSQDIIQTEQELQQNSAHKDYRTTNIYVTKLTLPKK